MSSNKSEVNESDLQNLTVDIRSTSAQVAALEGELDFSRLKLLGYKIALVAPSIAMIAGIALYLLNPLIAIILTALGFLFGIFETLKEIRGEKKHHQIYVKYTAAKSRLEFLKAIFSVRAAHEEKQA